MYRCVECHAIYKSCPEYCDCGNDVFEELYEEEIDISKTKPKRQKLTPEEIAEIEEEKMDRKKSLIALGVFAVLAIVVLVMPPHVNKKSTVAKQQAVKANLHFPSVESFWDDTVVSTHRAEKDPIANLPLLNKYFSSVGGDLRAYLVEIGGDFNRNWDKTFIKGTGYATVQFVIDKEGNLTSKKIISTSHNESLDEAVGMTITKVTKVNVPPDSYKGERIQIQFKVDNNGVSKVFYPQ